VTTIVSDPKVGVLSFGHTIEPHVIAALGVDMSIADLTDRILKLSAGKLCSNQATPHLQISPYPETCPICGKPVL